MYCHNKFISGYLKSKDLNDTNEPRYSSKVDRICRKMPQKSEMTAGIALIKKKKKKEPELHEQPQKVSNTKLGLLYIIYATLK